jgi:deoxyribose-phosphate aldolase
MSLASLIDHTILRPDCTLKDIKTICAEAVQHQFAAVCIPPFYINDAIPLLSDSNVKLATVIGFPMGYSATPSKVEEIKRGLDEGADEFDVVPNICAVKNGNWNYVQNDIESMTRTVHLKGKVIKVILEYSLLSEAEVAKICNICEKSGVNFVKTSTGFHGGATPEMVEHLRSILPKSIKIKASGGIRSASAAHKLVEAGADRIGSSAGVQLIQG